MLTNFDRRKFLKSVAVAGVGAGVAGAAEPRVAGKTALAARETIQTDVLVVGAGSSGVPAAIAAARSGARVVLLDDDAVPGGAPVDMYVAGPCGSPQVGIYKEMIERLTARHNISVHPERRATWFLPSSYLRVIMEMLRELPQIQLLCQARLAQVVVAEGARNRIEGVVIERGGNATQAIRAQVVIDATGTGEVAERAGCATLYGRESRNQFGEPSAPETGDEKIQECTWMFITQKVRPGAVMDLKQLRWMPNESGYGWIKKKVPEDVAAFLKRDAGVYLHWGGHIVCRDTRDPVAIAQAQLDAMEAVVELDGPKLLEFGYAMTLAPKLGMRESRRVVGDHVITLNDLVHDGWPEDVVAIGKYGVDAWGDKDAHATPVKIPRNGYGIPWRALLVKGMENLLVVGKAISSTHLAQSAVRVQPIVSQMGQAAGTAAAMAVARKTTPRTLSLAELQQELKKGGLLGEEEEENKKKKVKSPRAKVG